MDINYLLWLQQLREANGGKFDDFFLTVSQFGAGMIPYLVVLFIYWAWDKDLGERMVLGIAGSVMVNGTVKLAADVYRPWIISSSIHPVDGAIATAGGYSFPSGHTVSATSSYGALAAHYRRHVVFALLMVIIVILIMFSRNYLGVHTPQDVAGGFVLAAVVSFIMFKAMDWSEADRGGVRDVILWLIAMVLTAAAIYYVMNKSYPMDYNSAGKLIVDPAAMRKGSFTYFGNFAGAATGILIERHFTEAKHDIQPHWKAVRFITGALIFWVYQTYVFDIFLSSSLGAFWGRFVSGFILFIYCAGIHVLIFSRLEGRERQRIIRGKRRR